MEGPSERRLLAALLMVQFAFAGLSVAGKLVLPHVPPFALALCRIAAAAVVLVALERVTVNAPRPSWKDLRFFALLALLGVVLNQGLFLAGLQFTTATNAVLLVATIPAWTLLVAVVLKQETTGPLKLIGLATSFAGVAVLVSEGGLHFGTTTLLGNILILANSLSYSTFLVLSRPALARHDPLTVVSWVFVFGFIEMSILGVPALLQADWSSMGRDAWIAFGYILIFGTIISYGLNNWVLRHAPASRVASFVYLQPLVGVIAAALILDEPLGWRVALAGALILGGVTLANRMAPSRRAGMR